MLPSFIPAGLEECNQRKEYCGLASRLGVQPRSLSPEPRREWEQGMYAAFDRKTTGAMIFGVPWWASTSYLRSSCS